MSVIKSKLGPIGRAAYRTPGLNETFQYTGTMTPSGASVSGRGKKYTEKDFRDAYDAAIVAAGLTGKARVFMDPGLIEGFGAGSSDDPTFSDIGVAGRASRVLFYPKNGPGTVSLYGKSAKFVNWRGITLGGIEGGPDDDLGVLFVGGADFGLWRSTVLSFQVYGKTGNNTDDFSFTEIVCFGRVGPLDTAAFRSASTKPGPISNGRVIGCWLGPTYRPPGATSHTDTLQYSGSSEYDNFEVTDTVIVASTNHAYIIGSAGAVLLDNVALISHYMGKLYVPPMQGAGPVDSPIAINGGGQPGQLTMNNVDIVGEVKNAGAAMKGSKITNTRISDQGSYDALRKTYGVTTIPLDLAMGQQTRAQLVAAYGEQPTKAQLHALWNAVNPPQSGPFVPPENPEEPEEPEEPTNPPTAGSPIPSGTLTQANMPTYVDALTLATAPMVTTANTSTISGGTAIAPTDSRLQYTGSATKGIVASSSGYYRGVFQADKSAGGDPFFLSMYGAKIRTTAQTLEVKMRQRPDLSGTGVNGRIPIRIKVNGRWTSDRPIYVGVGNTGYETITPSSFSPGTEFVVKLAFPDSADREIEIVTMTEYAGFVVPSGAIVTAATAPIRKAVALADSIFGAEKTGLGNFSLTDPVTGKKLQHATYTDLSSLWPYAMQGLGYDNVINSGSGSTGFVIDGDTVRFSNADRMQKDVIDYAPDLVVVGTANNDMASGVTPAQVTTAANTVFGTLRAGLPNAIMVAFGCAVLPAMSQLTDAAGKVAAMNTAVAASATANGFWFYNPETGDTYNPAGVKVSDRAALLAGSAVQALSSDGTHPTQKGAADLGRELSEVLRIVHPFSGGEAPPEIFDPQVAFVTDPEVVIRGTAVIVATASVPSPATVRSVVFTTVDAGKPVNLGSGVKGAGSDYVLTFPTTGLATTGPKHYVVKMTATTSNGRTATAEATYTVDNSGTTAPVNAPPVVQLLAPLGGAVLPRNGQYLFRARATDDRLVGEVGWEVRNAAGTVTKIGVGELTSTANVYELTADMADVPTDTGWVRAYVTEAGDDPQTSTTFFHDVTIAAPPNEIDPTRPVISGVSDAPGKLTVTIVEPSIPAVEGQEIRYEWILEGVPDPNVVPGVLKRTWYELPNPEYEVQVTAYDEDGLSATSEAITVTVHAGDEEKPSKPGLTYSDLAAESAVLHGTGSTDDIAIREYVLRRGSEVIRRNESITAFASVPVQLIESTAYEYSLIAIDTSGNQSDPAYVTFKTPAKPIVIQPGWVPTGPHPVEGSTGPVEGKVLVRYSSDVRALDGRQLTPTQQVVTASKGKFLTQAGTPWLGYRSPNADDYIEWIEQFIGPDGKALPDRPRRFRFPPNTVGAVEYLDRIWFDDAPVGTSLPEWAQDLDARTDALEAAAEQMVTDVEASTAGAVAEVKAEADRLDVILDEAKAIAAAGAWSAQKQAQAQGFHMIYSATAPTQTTMYGVPVIWMNVPAAPVVVPVLPPAPLWVESNATYVIPSGVVGVEYRLGTSPSGLVLTQGQTYTWNKADGMVTVTARALPGYILPTTFSWSHTYLDTSKVTLVASDTFSGAASPTIVGRTTDNLLGGTTPLIWRGPQFTANPLWTPPNLNFLGKGYTGPGASGSSSLSFMSPPTAINPVLTGSTTGGTLAAGTYYYMVTATLAVGETGCIQQKSVVLTGSTSSTTLTWTAVAGATGYRIWRSTTSGTEKLLTTLGSGVLTFVDTGALTPGTVTPPYLDRGVGALIQGQLGLNSQYQRATFTVSGIAATTDSVQLAFSIPVSGGIRANGYQVELYQGNVRLYPGVDSATATGYASGDRVDTARPSTMNGAWDVYSIAGTLTAIAPGGQVYTTALRAYQPGSSAAERIPGNIFAFGVAGNAVVTNLRIYEVGV